MTPGKAGPTMNELEHRVHLLEIDVWRGDGPKHLSMTARLAMLEEVARNAKWGFRMLVGVLLTAVATLILEVVKH
jgi:hypothetical protein